MDVAAADRVLAHGQSDTAALRDFPYHWNQLVKRGRFEGHGRTDLPGEIAFWRSDLPELPLITAIYRFREGGPSNAECGVRSAEFSREGAQARPAAESGPYLGKADRRTVWSGLRDVKKAVKSVSVGFGRFRSVCERGKKAPRTKRPTSRTAQSRSVKAGQGCRKLRYVECGAARYGERALPRRPSFAQKLWRAGGRTFA